MSVSTLAHPPRHGAALTKFWLGVIFVVAIAVAMAWLGAGSLRGETTASGVNIRTIQAGTGPFIRPVDGIIIDYEGRLADGTVFDSSAARGPQPMIAGQSIPGFREALSHMQKGGRYQIHIPANLAYGASPPPGSVPPNSDLSFRVHIVEVVPNAALMTEAPNQLPPSDLPGGTQPGRGAPSAGAIPQAE